MIWVAVLVGVLVVVLLGVVVWAYQTANRLDRLYVRYDLSWQALDAALARRAVVARAVAADAYGRRPEGRSLTALADAAERAPRSGREAAENELSTALAMVEPAAVPLGLVAELADAEARVLLARRFHNDAVRDTLALRERRPVRWLRLSGRARRPEYFEIAERATTGAAGPATSGTGAAGPATSGTGAAGPATSGTGAAGLATETEVALAVADRRVSARVVLLDEDGAVLLFCGSDPAITDGTAPRWWFTVGGQTRPGEPLADAAARELAEETGLRVDPADLVGPVWRRDAVIDFNDTVITSQEFFFVHRAQRFEPSLDGRTPLELRYIHGHRWCDSATIEELVARGETVYPRQLSKLLSEANLLADEDGGSPARQLQAIR